MLRLRQYKEADAKKIAQWVQDKDVFQKWGGDLFGEYPIDAETIADMYKNKNGLCEEPDNFYPWVAFDDENGVVGSFIMRYLNGDTKLLRFGWVVIDSTIRGKGYGSKLLREIERYYVDTRYELFTSTRSVDNIRLYEKLGYKIFNEKKITDELVFVYMEKMPV